MATSVALVFNVPGPPSGVHLPTVVHDVLRKKNYPRSASLTYDSACSLYMSFRAWPETQQTFLGKILAKKS